MSKPNLIEAAFAITWADGALSVTRMPVQDDLSAFHPDAAKAHGFVEQDGLWVRELTQDTIETELQRVAAGLGRTLASYRQLAPEEVIAYFAQGEFRGDHVDDGKALRIDMDKARDRVRRTIRGIRPGRFASLDNAMKPLEAKAALGTMTEKDRLAMSGLEAQRQALRDAPADPAIDAAKTVDELKEYLAAF